MSNLSLSASAVCLLRTLLACSLLSLLSPGLGAAIYMLWPNIQGEVTVDGFQNHIELDSFQWGVGRGVSSPVGGNREASAPSVSEIVLTKRHDISSSKLLREALVGTGGLVELFFVRTLQGTPTTYISIKLHNTLVTGYSFSSGGDQPTESFSLNFTKIEFRSIPANTPPGTPLPQPVIWSLEFERIE